MALQVTDRGPARLAVPAAEPGIGAAVPGAVDFLA